MAATNEALGEIHSLLASLYRELLQGREEMIVVNGEVLIDPATEQPRMRKVFPTAAELSTINAFLKNNNITAAGGGGQEELEKLKQLMAERTKGRQPVLPDPYDSLPAGFGGLQ